MLLSSCSFYFSKLSFVPKHSPCTKENIQLLQEFVDIPKKILILTGAGVSTESGIPDYRSEGVGLYAKSNKKPILYQDFLKSLKARQRYWLRNYVGWPRFSSVLPNINHKCLSDWENKGKIHCIVTQNVDRLHHKAGSRYIIELHGSAYQVECINCSYMKDRHSFQEELQLLNSHISYKSDYIRPDGDIEILEDEILRFQVPDCPRCKGILKPHIVFFGDNVPKARVAKVKEELLASDALVVLGSSLTVFSALRYVIMANEHGIPVAIVNIGETRGDKFASLKMSVKCGDILPKVKS